MTVEEIKDDEASGSAGGDQNMVEDEEVKAKKRKERLEQNRISARESRKRKKTMIEELQRTVITLSRENKELNERNEGLRRQLMEIGAKYPNIVPLQAIVGQGAATQTGTADPTAGGATTTTATTEGAAVTTPAPAGGGSGGGSALSSLNPMNWLGGGGGASASSSTSAPTAAPPADAAANQTDV